MGSRNPDRLSPEEWRAGAPTVAAMIEKNWRVSCICRACRLALRVNLHLVAHVGGARFSLWCRTQPCKREGCRGVCDFYGTPPALGRPIRLDAPWPGDR